MCHLPLDFPVTISYKCTVKCQRLKPLKLPCQFTDYRWGTGNEEYGIFNSLCMCAECKQPPIPRTLQHCSIQMPYVLTLAMSTYSGMLHLPSKACTNPTLGTAYPATKAPGHTQLFAAHVSEALLFLALDAGVGCSCLSSFFAPESLFLNQRGFHLSSGLAGKYPFPCLWQLHLQCPTSGEEDASLCYEISSWASIPPSAPFYQLFRTRLPEGCSYNVFLL